MLAFALQCRNRQWAAQVPGQRRLNDGNGSDGRGLVGQRRQHAAALHIDHTFLGARTVDSQRGEKGGVQTGVSPGEVLAEGRHFLSEVGQVVSEVLGIRGRLQNYLEERVGKVEEKRHTSQFHTTGFSRSTIFFRSEHCCTLTIT